MANSVSTDPALYSVASDLGLHYLQMPICPNTKVIRVKYVFSGLVCVKQKYTKIILTP